MSPGPTARSYIVKTSEGQTFRRNSWFLRSDKTSPGSQLSKSFSPNTSMSSYNDLYNVSDPMPSIPGASPNMPSTSTAYSGVLDSSISGTEKISVPCSGPAEATTTRSGRVVKKPDRYLE
ncbi:hypothetical protein JTE90_004391 [Oedothorax gibbosus]|uniref:Uncharacterized protein n=1 Tax=Oedothorax gibbosus TaxID=931172 RepID=A0AAV6UNV0_9ARAC|nr:hypothetical protein JTE90_004391 [Oedothorax gibbosus]